MKTFDPKSTKVAGRPILEGRKRDIGNKCKKREFRFKTAEFNTMFFVNSQLQNSSRPINGAFCFINKHSRSSRHQLKNGKDVYRGC